MVTAQKKEQGLREVPLSVATLSDEKLDAITAAGQDIRLLSSRVPSLLIESSFGRTLPRFYIRGLGNTDFDLNASQPVSLVYDGVVLENPILKGYPIFDMERIEVLRGPQGTLFGRNTPAGIVKFESRKPTFDNERLRPLLLRHLRHHAVRGRGRRHRRRGQAGRPRFVPLPGPQRLGEEYQHLHRRRMTPSAATRISPAACSSCSRPATSSRALSNVHMRDLDGTARLFQANIVESGSNQIRDGFKRDEIAIDGAERAAREGVGRRPDLEYDVRES